MKYASGDLPDFLLYSKFLIYSDKKYVGVSEENMNWKTKKNILYFKLKY